MQLTLKKVLTFDSLTNALVLTGNNKLSNKITGIMVMEAPDIENWASSGTIILSSYYALQNLSDVKLKRLFKTMKQLDIAAFILKKDRLIKTIPPAITLYCKEFDIPLIQIPKNLKYEKIILEVTRALLNQNLSLLDIYHKTHDQFTRLALKEPSLEDTLFVLEELIHKPVSLKNLLNDKTISTNSDLSNYSIQQSTPLRQQQYMNHDYVRSIVLYTNKSTSLRESTILTVSIPNLNEIPYELVIHEQKTLSAAEDYMAIENAVSFLQMELLKRYAISQNDQTYRNEIISDLLNNRIENKEDLLQKAAILKLKPTIDYQVASFTFNVSVNYLETEQQRLTQFRIFFREELSRKNLTFAYLGRKDKLILIIEKNKEERLLKDILNQALLISKKRTHTEKLQINSSISIPGSIFELADLYDQTREIQRAIELFGEPNQLYTYKDIGIFQLLLKSTNSTELEQYIPESLLRLHQQDKDLTKTLKTFLDTTQNYKATGDQLFIHPKTVRYRINKIKELIHINFSDPEELLQINIGLRLLKLI